MTGRWKKTLIANTTSTSSRVTFAEQGAQATDTVLEIGLGRAEREAVGDLAQCGSAAGLHHQHTARAAAHTRAKEDTVGSLGQAGAGRHWRGLLLDREALAGQQRLVDEQVFLLQHATVGGN